MPKPPDPLAEFVVDQLRDWAPVTARRLFGGWGIYNGSTMFGLIARDAIYFRVDEANRPDYEAATAKAFIHAARKRAGAQSSGPQPFRYRMPNGKIVEMAYYEVPAEIIDDPEALGDWATKAHRAALRAARTKAAKRIRPANPAPRTPAKAGRKRLG